MVAGKAATPLLCLREAMDTGPRPSPLTRTGKDPDTTGCIAAGACDSGREDAHYQWRGPTLPGELALVFQLYYIATHAGDSNDSIYFES